MTRQQIPPFYPHLRDDQPDKQDRIIHCVLFGFCFTLFICFMGLVFAIIIIPKPLVSIDFWQPGDSVDLAVSYNLADRVQLSPHSGNNITLRKLRRLPDLLTTHRLSNISFFAHKHVELALPRRVNKGSSFEVHWQASAKVRVELRRKPSDWSSVSVRGRFTWGTTTLENNSNATATNNTRELSVDQLVYSGTEPVLFKVEESGLHILRVSCPSCEEKFEGILLINETLRQYNLSSTCGEEERHCCQGACRFQVKRTGEYLVATVAADSPAFMVNVTRRPRASLILPPAAITPPLLVLLVCGLACGIAARIHNGSQETLRNGNRVVVPPKPDKSARDLFVGVAQKIFRSHAAPLIIDDEAVSNPPICDASPQISPTCPPE